TTADEHGVTRTGAGGKSVGAEFAGHRHSVRIQLIGQNLVASEIRNEEMSVAGDGRSPMRMGSRIPVGSARTALMLHEGRDPVDAAICGDRKSGEAPSPIIGNEEAAPVGRNLHVAGRG